MDKYLRNRKIKLKIAKEIEPQEIFLDELARKKEEEFGVSEKKIEVPLAKKNLYVFFGFFIILAFIFWAKSFQLQILRNEEFSLLADRNRMRLYPVAAERGIIYDRDFKRLVFNSPSFDLIYDKEDFSVQDDENLKIQKTKAMEEISRITQEDFEQLEKRIQESESAILVVSENLKQDDLIAIEAKINDLPGFRIEKKTMRNYAGGETFAHILGYTGKITKDELRNSEDYYPTDYTGKTGLEKFYENALKGEPGFVTVEKNALGMKLSEKTSAEPAPGKNLILWIDGSFQEKIETELKKVLKNIGAKKAAAVAMNPNTGGVLALVTVPSYDPNLFSRGISREEFSQIKDNPLKPLFNRAVSGIGYPTGSTIKPLIAAAALEEKIISPETEINDDIGKIVISNPYYPEYGLEQYEYHDWKIHGRTNLRKALAESCNVYFYTIGGGYGNIKGLGAEKIKYWLKQFGWGEKTGIDLPEEGKGILPEIGDKWTLGNTYHFSIGQGPFSITPLQVASAFLAIANKGTIWKPKIVQKITAGDGETAVNIEPEILYDNFISEESMEIVRQGMRQAVTSGSAVLLNSLPVKAAAKTGTAQSSKPGLYYNWVTVFAPYENPEIVLTLVIEDVPEDTLAALPVTKGVLEWYFSKERKAVSF